MNGLPDHCPIFRQNLGEPRLHGNQIVENNSRISEIEAATR